MRAQTNIVYKRYSILDISLYYRYRIYKRRRISFINDIRYSIFCFTITIEYISADEYRL